MAATFLLAVASLPILVPLSFMIYGVDPGVRGLSTPESFQAYRATAPLRRAFGFGFFGKRHLLLTVAFFACMAVAGALHAEEGRSPAPLLSRAGLGEKYQPADFIKPAFQRADFDGDGVADTAVLVREAGTGKRGVVILSGRNPAHYYAIGAGTAFRGSDDLKWLRRWSVYRKTVALETRFDPETGDIIGGREVRLARPALLLEDPRAHAGGLVYWNGRRYVWIHQGE